jgi:hypothetical protein
VDLSYWTFFQLRFRSGPDFYMGCACTAVVGQREGGKRKAQIGGGGERIGIFLFILQNYTIVSKFIRFDHQSLWRTAIGGLTAVVRSTVVGPAGGKASRCGPRRVRPICRAPRRQAQPPWAHNDRVPQTSCATTAGRQSLKIALKQSK